MKELPLVSFSAYWDIARFVTASWCVVIFNFPEVGFEYPMIVGVRPESEEEPKNIS